MIVDVGIATGKNQSNRWWPQIMGELLNIQERGVVRIGRILTVGSALPDFSKTEIAALNLRRLGLTDTNRTEIVHRHLEEGDQAEAVWWIDDDTVPPAGALEQLVSLDAPVAAGVYFLRHPPCNPIAYYRTEGGKYSPLWDYQRGEVLPVDSVGMGCTLVRSYVYRQIMAEYLVFQRKLTGSLKAIHRDDVTAVGKLPKSVGFTSGKVVVGPAGDAVYCEPLRGPIAPDEVSRWPFYVMEHERTEDHYFCEMVHRVGLAIMVDTQLECQHWGDTAIVGDNFREVKRWEATHARSSASAKIQVEGVDGE